MDKEDPFQYVEKTNLGKKINSKEGEISPAISPDGQTLYFTKLIDDQAYFFYSRQNKNSEWTKSKAVPYPFTKIQNSTGYNITPDGNVMLLRGVFEGFHQISRGYSICKKTTKGWSAPTKLHITNYSNYDLGNHYSAWLCTDGRTLLLDMEPKANSNNGNLYVSQLQDNGHWSEPKSLGPKINSDTTISGTPFLAADGVTLYYTTNKYFTYGGTDLYMTTRLDDSWTNWTQPVNLGPTVNSERFDAYFSIPASGKFGYLVSRDASFGREDIFRLELPEEFKPKSVQLISGYVLNTISGKGIGVQINVHNLLDNKLIATAQSDSATGYYQIILPTGKSYTFFAEIEDQFTLREQVDLTEITSYEEKEINLEVQPVEKGERFTLNNIFFVPTKDVLMPNSLPELNKLVKFLDSYPDMRIRVEGHTDNNGDPKANLKLSQDRADKVKDYLNERGIEAHRIEAQGFGESDPLNDNSTENKRRQNRRVEFVILNSPKD